MAKLVCHGQKYTKGAIAKIEAEIHELRKFKQMAENYLAEHGLKDYFRKVFIHSNNQEL